MARLLRS
jgi:hypothetical protein